jgi:hypothetical protein
LISHIRQERGQYFVCRGKRVSEKNGGGMGPMKKKRSLDEAAGDIGQLQDPVNAEISHA